MDVLEILDRLDEYLSECARVPLVGRLMVDEDEVFNLIDDLRAAFPQELEQSRWLLKERDRILAEARREAEEILRDAQGQIASIASESAITKEARAQAEELMERARDVAREINLGAREYADDLMKRILDVLEEATERVSQGRKELSTDKESPDSQAQTQQEDLFEQAAATAPGSDSRDDWAAEEPASARSKRRRTRS